MFIQYLFFNRNALHETEKDPMNLVTKELYIVLKDLYYYKSIKQALITDKYRI